MNLRQDLLNLIEHLSDEQLAVLMPLVMMFRENHQSKMFSSETSTAYQDWTGAENDIYDEIFADELATR
jgi:hypothetical protein